MSGVNGNSSNKRHVFTKNKKLHHDHSSGSWYLEITSGLLPNNDQVNHLFDEQPLTKPQTFTKNSLPT